MTFLLLLLVVAAGIAIKCLVKISDQLNAASPHLAAIASELDGFSDGGHETGGHDSLIKHPVTRILKGIRHDLGTIEDLIRPALTDKYDEPGSVTKSIPDLLSPALKRLKRIEKTLVLLKENTSPATDGGLLFTHLDGIEKNLMYLSHKADEAHPDPDDLTGFPGSQEYAEFRRDLIEQTKKREAELEKEDLDY